jgi:hypothetical protein
MMHPDYDPQVKEMLTLLLTRKEHAAKREDYDNAN